MNAMRACASTVGAVLLISAVANASAGPAYRLEPGCVHVLVDRSHEWLFAYDDLGDRILPPHGFQVVLCDATLDSKAALKDFDIVVVAQISTTIEFLPAEIEALRRYVAEGGKLLLVARPDRPVAAVAAAFGLSVLATPGSPPLLVANWLSADHGADGIAHVARVPFTVRHSAGATRLVVDEKGTPVAVAAAYGKGRVLLFADDGTYWDFCAQRDEQMRVPHTALTAALFKHLASGPPPGRQGPSATRVTAELEANLGGVMVRCSRPIATRTRSLLEILPRVAALVEDANGGLPPAERLVVNVLATAGGGWSGGREIGVQCDGAPAANISVIAHELTHSWSGSLPAAFGEGWASLVGMRAARQLGFPQPALEERRYWHQLFLQADPTMQTLDIAQAEGVPALRGACEGKAMWMIEQLEERFGNDFMRRFLEVRHALGGADRQPQIQEVLYYFSLAAGGDLSRWYTQLGISVRPPPAVSPERIRSRVAAYRGRIQHYREDSRRLQEYRELAATFTDDTWRTEWQVRDNLYGAANDWVDSFMRPPEGLAHIQAPAGEDRRGVLVVHAGARDRPCQLERSLDLPQDCPTQLYIGGARRWGGGDSVLRLSANGEQLWLRVLDRDGWFHDSVDLSAYAGQRVVLLLESDTQGGWGCREVLLDYLKAWSCTETSRVP